jgi:hypothetical protein
LVPNSVSRIGVVRELVSRRDHGA